MICNDILAIIVFHVPKHNAKKMLSVSKKIKRLTISYKNVVLCVTSDVLEKCRLDEHRHVKISKDFSDIVEKIPLSITRVTFDNDFYGKIIIPKHIKYVKCGFLFSCRSEIFASDLLELSHIDLGYKHNKIHKLSRNIKHLTLGMFHNENIDKLKLLNKLEYLKCGQRFNKDVDNLPNSLVTLILGRDFNQKINNLPKNLKTLILGDEFNQEVCNLPDNIETLKFGFCFNKPINMLPNNIIKLELGYCFNQDINNLPDSITNLTLNFSFSKYVDKIPKNLKYLRLPNASYLEFFSEIDLSNVNVIFYQKKQIKN